MRGPETIYAWRYTGSHHEGQWNRSKLSHAEAEYIRADIADARVAAAYEAAANAAKGEGESEFFNPIQAIRALTPNDAKAALEAVRREARAEAVREAAVSCATFDGRVSYSDFVTGQSTAAQQIRSAILALIDNPQEDKT